MVPVRYASGLAAAHADLTQLSSGQFHGLAEQIPGSRAKMVIRRLVPPARDLDLKKSAFDLMADPLISASMSDKENILLCYYNALLKVGTNCSGFGAGRQGGAGSSATHGRRQHGHSVSGCIDRYRSGSGFPPYFLRRSSRAVYCKSLKYDWSILPVCQCAIAFL